MNTDLQFAFPADLGDFRPTLIIDTREKLALPLSRLTTTSGSLATGDYSIAGLENEFAVERKSVPDLVQCCGPERQRFEKELCRLRGFRFARLLIVGTAAEIAAGKYHSNFNPHSVFATLQSFEIRYVPVVWADTPADAAARVESWAMWFARQMLRMGDTIRRASEPATRI